METNNQTPNLVLDETIEDVDKSAQSLVFKRHLTATVIVLSALVVWESFMGFLLITEAPTTENDPRIIGMIVPVIILIGVYLLIRNYVHNLFMEQFALANGLSYRKTGTPNYARGALFDLGHNHSFKNIINGVWDGNNITLFNYRYVIGSGKSRTTYSCTVFEIEYPSPLVPILLVVDRQFFGGITPLFGDWKKIKPEGNFDDNFDLYSKEKLEIEALQIFTPDVMEQLLTNWPEFNLEFNDNELLIFYNKTITTKTELQRMYNLLQYLIKKVEPRALRMQSSLQAMQEVMN